MTTPVKRTKQYAVHLPPEVVAQTRRMAEQDTVARGNWSRWVEELLRRVLERNARKGV